MMYINSLFIGINIRSSFECAKKVQHEKSSINNSALLTANVRARRHKIHEVHIEVSVCCKQDQSESFSQRHVTS